MIALPPPPAFEPPRITSLDGLAPAMRTAVMRIENYLTHRKVNYLIFETVRTAERQEYLFGFGRDYDDGRGIVTKARTGLYGWHLYGLAIDIVENDATPWKAPQSFWNEIGAAYVAAGLKWGGHWPMLDLPHGQWGKCRRNPSQRSRDAFNRDGVEAVWRLVGAHRAA